MVDGQTNDGLTFVDETIRIPHFEDCLYAHEGEAVGKITLGCVITLILLCLIGLGLYWWYKRRTDSEDEVNLVGNMERGNSSPQSSEFSWHMSMFFRDWFCLKMFLKRSVSEHSFVNK